MSKFCRKLEHDNNKSSEHSEISISMPKSKEEWIVSDDFTAESSASTEMSVKKDTKVFVLDKNLNGWWYVEYKEGKGYVPSSILVKNENDTHSSRTPIKTEMRMYFL